MAFPPVLSVRGRKHGKEVKPPEDRDSCLPVRLHCFLFVSLKISWRFALETEQPFILFFPPIFFYLSSFSNNRSLYLYLFFLPPPPPISSYFQALLYSLPFTSPLSYLFFDLTCFRLQDDASLCDTSRKI